jgi:hypothetical protein
MKTEYRTYTIEPDHRNPYAQKPDWMFYPTEEGIQHDADLDGDDMKYCGNCKWASTLEEAQQEIDDLIIESQEKRIQDLEERVKELESAMQGVSVILDNHHGDDRDETPLIDKFFEVLLTK